MWAPAALALTAILLLAGVVAAASNNKGTTKSVTSSLPAGGAAAAGQKCPDNKHATGGGLAVNTGFNPATSTGTETYPQTNYPPGKAKWRSGASSPNGEPAANVTSYLRCEKNSFGKIVKRTSRSVTLASGVAAAVSVACPQNSQVLGGGYSVSPTFDAGAAGNATSEMRIVQSRRTSSATWTVTAINPRQPTSQLTVSSLCEKKGKQVKTKTDFSPLAAGSRETVTAKCSDNQHVVAGGFAVTPLVSNVRIPVVDTSAPSGNRSWNVGVYGENNIPSGSGITAYAYCKSNKPPS
jgi:hypothetical protein